MACGCGKESATSDGVERIAVACKEIPELCRQNPVAWKMERRRGNCGGVASYVGKGSAMSGGVERSGRVGEMCQR